LEMEDIILIQELLLCDRENIRYNNSGLADFRILVKNHVLYPVLHFDLGLLAFSNGSLCRCVVCNFGSSNSIGIQLRFFLFLEGN
jgi:hypothetical protein